MIKVGARNLKAITDAGWQNIDGRDVMYVDKIIARKDYHVNSTEGKDLFAKIKSAYPDYSGLPFSHANLVGGYDGYREPYENSSVSFYLMHTKPSATIREKYGVLEATENLQPWYGLKFDLTKNEVIFKCVIKKIDCNKPELPEGDSQFFATTHTPDKSMSDWVDYYVSGVEPEKIKAFCNAKGLKYPFPDDLSKTDLKNIWCWGFVFNKSSLEYGAVKGYVRVGTS